MKREGYLYKKVCDLDNIFRAIENAAKGKKHRRVVRNVMEHKQEAAEAIRDMLVTKQYRPRPYRKFVIKDGATQKERTIFCPAFYPDQIIHWALIQVTQTVLQRGMYVFCCGSIPGRGIGYGKRYIERWMRRDRKNTKYCLKMDIKKYYPSINQDVLKAAFRRKIKDADVLHQLE